MYEVGTPETVAVERSELHHTVREHRRYLVGLAGRLGRGRVDPEDLAQDVLERWLRCAPTVPLARSRGWMRVVLRNLLIDRLRRQRAARVDPVDGVDLVAIAADAAPWWHDLDASAVALALAGLPPALRDTFLMFAFEARSYRQIADQLHIAMGTVGTRIRRARVMLRRRLGGRGRAGRGACA